MERLKRILRRINRRGYKAYRDLEGRYRFGIFDLHVQHVQADPFAPPSLLVVQTTVKQLKLPEWSVSDDVRRIATADYLLRRMRAVAAVFSRKRGTGNSGLYEFARTGQRILKRSGCEILEDRIIFRFGVGLPADGRSVKSEVALKMFESEIPKILESVEAKSLDLSELQKVVDTVVDQHFIRQSLPHLGLVAFIADGSILPRRSGVDERPMSGAVPFKSPESLRVQFKLPSGRIIEGMGIPEGVTLIAGGGFHGKSTLLEAVQFGVYNHVIGDGREFAIAREDTVKIRAEDGRYIDNVDISGFIRGLPSGYDTKNFRTEDASGSTSQAANIVEALELGAKVLLIDEDTSATNFMLRDELMRELIRKEPIVPFIDRARELYERFGVSSLVVVGGAGDYLSVADTVILMEDYLPRDATHRARVISSKRPYTPKPSIPFQMPNPRKLLPDSLNPYRGKKIKVDAKSLNNIVFGRFSIELSAVEQLGELGQSRAIAKMILYMAKNYAELTLKDMAERAIEDVLRRGFGVLGRVDGMLALPRKFELIAALNRLRCAKFVQTGEN